MRPFCTPFRRGTVRWDQSKFSRFLETTGLLHRTRATTPHWEQEDDLSKGIVSGVRAAYLVAGTASAVAMALLNERTRPLGSRLTPATAAASSPAHNGASAEAYSPPTRGIFAASREAASRRLGQASLLGLGVLALAAMIPAATTMASGFRGSPPAPAAIFGPSDDLRAASSAGAGWEESYAAAIPSASDRGAIVIAAAAHQRDIDTLLALNAWAEREEAAKGGRISAAGVPAHGQAQSLNRASGYAPGTVVRARVTIYGCTGSGGGFCGGMSAGITVFEGAAACSSDMPFGTKFTLEGDPTGRVYECLNRGMLAAPWVDIFFYDTADGFAWASQLGSTHANLTIVN